MTFILSFRLEVPYWTSFRRATTNNFQETYILPPFTTLAGLMANALNHPQDDYAYLFDLRMTVVVERCGEIVSNLSNIFKVTKARTSILSKKDITKLLEPPTPQQMQLRADIIAKLIKVQKDESYLQQALTQEQVIYVEDFQPQFYTTPVVREKIIQSVYHIYLTTPNVELLRKIQYALQDPARPLYLGESDDMILIDNIILNEYSSQESHIIYSIMRGIHEGGIVIKLPVAFKLKGRDQYSCVQEIFTVPHTKFDFTKPISCFDVEGRNICF